MLDDDSEYELRRQILAQADDDVAAFIAQLDSDVGSGVPPPPRIEVTEVSSQPIELELVPFGGQGSETVPTQPGSGGGGPPPCCPAATLVCDQISASKSKCGFTEFNTPSDPPKYYLSKVATTHVVKIQSCNGSGTCEAGIDGTRTTTTTYDSSDCSSTSNTVRSGDWSSIGGFETLTFHRCDGSTGHTDPPPSGSCTDISTTEQDCSAVTNFHHSSPCSPTDTTLTRTDNTVLSDEYTTTELISNTEAALPGYTDCFNCGYDVTVTCEYPPGESCTCLASRDLADDESSYSIARFKYKFIWLDGDGNPLPLEEDCTICWIERTYDSDGNPVSDNQMCETVLAGETESTVYEVMEPAENGTVGIVYPTIICCTDGVCSQTDETTCTDGGGTSMGPCCDDGEDACCSPNPC